MLQHHQVEELITVIAAMDRHAVIRRMSAYPAHFPLDFSSEFLSTVCLDRLRHIFLALCLQCQQLPEIDHGDIVATAQVA